MKSVYDTDCEARTPGSLGLWSLLVCSIFPMVGLFAMGPALPKVAAAFHGNSDAELMTQMIGGASGLTFALGSPVIGILIGRWGFRAVYVPSLVAFAVFGTLPVVLGSLPLILVTRGLLGICVAGIMTAGLAGLSTLPGAIRPSMYGRNAMLSSVGAILIFPAVGALSAIDWHLPFFIHLLSLLAVPAALTLPPGRLQARSHPGPDSSGKGLGVSPLLIALAAFIGLIMYFGPMYAPFYLYGIGVTDPRLAALPLSAMSVASLIMTSSYGRLHARWGTRSLFMATLVLAGGGLIAAGLAPTLPIFMAAMFILSCGIAMFTPNLSSHIAETSLNTAGGIGWAMSAMFSVQVVFPFLARIISQAVGPAGVFLVFGSCALVAGVATGASALLNMRPLVEARSPAE